MSNLQSTGPGKNRFRNAGSILIYVLWILALISILAFNLSAASRATTLNQSAFAKQLKQQMQLNSAVEFAKFKISANQWEDQRFDFVLNDQQVEVAIFNEAGFISIYQLENESLKKVFEHLDLDQGVVNALERAYGREEDRVRFNSFAELLPIEGIDRETLQRLIPLVSIFHTERVNPELAPVEVLGMIHGIDLLRVRQLRESTDAAEKFELRSELVQSMFQNRGEVSDASSVYYRVHVLLDGNFHRVFLKVNRENTDYLVLLTESSQ